MSADSCSGDPKRNSCLLLPSELGEYDVIAATRATVSSLSILGTLSLIILAIGKKQVLKSKIHPIFVLSVADLILACLWIVGSSFWLRDINNTEREWCLVVSLCTVIMQCVTINLTLVYAIMAYHGIKKYNIRSQQSDNRSSQLDIADSIWSPLITMSIYITAWLIPIILVLLTFAGIAGSNKNIVSGISECSCWCLPVYGNVLPYAMPREHSTAKYLYDVYKLISSYSSVISVHYLVVFILLIIIYRKLLRHIKKIRADYEETHKAYCYGATTTAFILRQSKAKIRVFFFILVFIINGLFNFLLSIGLTVFGLFYQLQHGVQVQKYTPSAGHSVLIILLLLQALTVPMQGFLNAIVYGWTREDFVNAMSLAEQDPHDQEFTHEENQPRNQPREHKKNETSHSLFTIMSAQRVYDSLQGTEIETLTDDEMCLWDEQI